MSKQLESHEYDADLNFRYSGGSAKRFDNYWNLRLNEMLDDSRFVLEIGCGIGTTVKDLSDNGRECYGIEIKKDFLKYSRAGKVINASAYKIPFKEGTFDAVLYRGTLHHLDSPRKSLNESYRVLKKDGILLLSEPFNDPYSMQLLRWLMFKPDYHEPLYSKELGQKLNEIGFNIEKNIPFGHLSFALSLRDIYDIEGKIPSISDYVDTLVRFEQNVIEKIPFIKDQAFHRIVKARKI